MWCRQGDDQFTRSFKTDVPSARVADDRGRPAAFVQAIFAKNHCLDLVGECDALLERAYDLIDEKVVVSKWCYVGTACTTEKIVFTILSVTHCAHRLSLDWKP